MIQHRLWMAVSVLFACPCLSCVCLLCIPRLEGLRDEDEEEEEQRSLVQCSDPSRNSFQDVPW